MTLATTTRLVSYNGTGTVGPFPYGFMILDAADLRVTVIDITGAETVLTLTTDYTVTGVRNRTGGNVTLVASLAIGSTLVIERWVAPTQTKSFRTEGKFFASSHEDAFDKVTMVQQQHSDVLDRTLQLPLLSAVSPTLPAPSANEVLGWDATATKITNQTPVAGPAGDRGPAGAGGPIPIVTDDAGRAALFPAPAVDNATWNKGRGYIQRFGAPASGANKWLSSGLTRDAGPVVSDIAKGAAADGVSDDSAFLTAMDTAVATSGIAEMDPGPSTGIRSVNTNLTLNARHLKIYKGSMFNVTVGHTLTINGFIEAGDYPIFDPTMLGTVRLTAKQVVNAMWAGVVGSNAVNDTPALNLLKVMVADYGTAEFPGAVVQRLDSTWTILARRGITYKSRVGPHPDGTNATQFTWNGGVGGSMIKLSSCDHVSIENMYVNMGSRGAGNYATVGIEINDTGINSVTGTHCRVHDCLIKGSQMPAGVVYDCVLLGPAGGNNQEYHLLTENGFFGSDGQDVFGPTQGVKATIAGGSLGVATISGAALQIGRAYRFQCAGAGAAGVGLDTTLTMTSTTVGTLTVAASNAVTSAFCLIGQFEGRGVHVGNSSNAKAHFISHNYFIHVYRGLYQENGSSFSFKNNYSSCCACIELAGGSESFEDQFSNSEQSWQFCLMTVNGNGGYPVRFEASRFGNLHTPPNKGYFEFIGGCGVDVVNCGFDDKPESIYRVAGGAPLTGSTAYNFANFSGRFNGTGNYYANGWTVQEVGYLDANGIQVNLGGCTIHFDEPGFTVPGQSGVLGGTVFISATDKAPVVTVEVRSKGAVPGNKMIASRARVIRGANGNIGDIMVGFQGTVARDAAAGRFDHEYRLFEADMGTVNTGATGAQEIIGYNVEPGSLTGSGTSPITGIKIKDLQTNPTNQGVVRAIQQLGLADLVLFNGDTTFGSGFVEKATAYIDIGAAGNATPNAAGAMLYRYRMAGAATVNNPTGLVKGRRLKLIMFNNSGAPVTPALGAKFLGAGFGAIGAAKSRSREYSYDDVLDKLEPISAVSEDF